MLVQNRTIFIFLKSFIFIDFFEIVVIRKLYKSLIILLSLYHTGLWVSLAILPGLGPGDPSSKLVYI
jgi:hypothetical protein